MKYAVIRISNGSFNIEKANEDIKVIKDKYFEVCQSYNTTPNIDATVEIVDGNLDPIEGGKYKEHFFNVTPEQAEPQGE